MALTRPSCAAAVALGIVLLPPSAALAASQLVTIQSFAFAPSATTINLGESVTWTNRDPVTHTATADGGGFDTGMLAPGMSKTIQLSVAGTFGYHCAIHPAMKGTLTVVAPVPTPQPTPAATAPPPAATPPAPITPALPPTLSPTPSPTGSPTSSPSPLASPTATAIATPSRSVASPGPAAGPVPDLGGGPGLGLAIGGLVLAVGLAGLAVALYRRR